MSGAIPLFPLYAFMAWTGNTSPLPFQCVYDVLCCGTEVLLLVIQSLSYGLGWIQYIPSKQSRFGVKIYKLCKSSTGYVWNCMVYTGKDTIYGQRHPEEQTSLRIVLEVAHDLLDKGYSLYLDNWYTSPNLVDTLCTRKTVVVGAMRTNRKEFPDFVKRARI